jgi:hypothetical protein
VSEFHEKIRKGDHNGALREPPIPPSPHAQALLLRERLCFLIDSGLRSHPTRLNEKQWRQIQSELRGFDPSLRSLTNYLAELIALTQRIAIEDGGSHGVWNLMEAASFQTWAGDLVEASAQYRQACEALHAR